MRARVTSQSSNSEGPTLSVYLPAGTAASTTPATLVDHLPSARPRHYPSDTSDAEWAVLAPHIPAEAVARSGRGYDAGKKVNGRKRHIAVDTCGLLLAVLVTAAGVQDRDGVRPSMGSVGDSYDNALMESFWSTPKIELVYRTSWRTATRLRTRSSDTSTAGTTPAASRENSAT
ncbi:hypothetical protein Aau02nite_47900 [Amorphoplanes auranticolor]|uniref:Transposase IS4-like domain-containing protein n=1 Tax=Actinoplanes auranticolor TaxID=47988 RepID=A0A919SHP9_9ACTN|nr:hypothetical protein Aau02nite_47900 [Actinoplanes auranticolor]